MSEFDNDIIKPQDDQEFQDDSQDGLPNELQNLRDETEDCTNFKDSYSKIEEKKIYTRDECVYLTKLFDRAEQYEEAVDNAVNFIKMKPILNSDERACFANVFKNLVNQKRASIRYLESVKKKEKKALKNPSTNNITTVINNNVESLEEIIQKVEDELNSLINLMQEILDEMLLPNSKKPEAQVFYMKLKGDYYRYKAEFSKDEEKEISADLAEQSYNDAYMLSEESLPITSLVRVSLAVNFSIFYYEEKNMIDEAIMIAKSCFEEAIKMVDEVDDDKAKDYILLVNLLKENIIFWNSEKPEDEELSNN